MPVGTCSPAHCSNHSRNACTPRPTGWFRSPSLNIMQTPTTQQRVAVRDQHYRRVQLLLPVAVAVAGLLAMAIGNLHLLPLLALAYKNVPSCILAVFHLTPNVVYGKR